MILSSKTKAGFREIWAGLGFPRRGSCRGASRGSVVTDGVEILPPLCGRTRAARVNTASVIRLAGDRRMPPSPQVNDDEIGKSESRENLSSDEGTFSQEYFVYFKKK